MDDEDDDDDEPSFATSFKNSRLRNSRCFDYATLNVNETSFLINPN